MKRRLWLATAAVVTLAAAGAGAADLADVKARGELRWGGDLQGGEPYVFEDEQHPGKIQGFEVEIAEALARELGVRAKFMQNDWSNLVPALERGDFDVVLNGLEETPERRERILLSAPYYTYGETLTVRKGSPFRSLNDLRGKRVGTLNQTVAHDLLKASPLETVLYEGQQEPYMDLAKGRTDAVLLDHVIADRYGCVLPELRCLPEDVARGHYVLGIAKDAKALQAAIDQALGKLQRDGELERILTRWKLWDARQRPAEPAATPSATPAPAPSAPPPSGVTAAAKAVEPARHFGRGHAWLFLQGALVTLLISVFSFALASPVGIALATLRLYTGRPGRWLAAAYVEVFRGTPLLLQLYVLYFGLADVIRLEPMTAAVLGLALNYGAYEAEVYRGALSSVPQGQTEAARALGLSRWQALRHVVFPQALRTALPAVTNDFVALLKDSSLISVITVVELTKRMTILAVELRDWITPGLMCAGLYFVMSFPLARWARRIERRLEPIQARADEAAT
ncbi:MAG TPA: ABC transporter substrate-binding protein/permease [Polyangiaceae bacterium]|nr:ABC transporter substrate-binding protein/permease [Polyangiaceae bacterium]